MQPSTSASLAPALCALFRRGLQGAQSIDDVAQPSTVPEEEVIQTAAPRLLLVTSCCSRSIREIYSTKFLSQGIELSSSLRQEAVGKCKK